MKTILCIALLGLAALLPAQNVINLSFTGININSYVDLDSILIRNLDQPCDTVLHAPDTNFQLILTSNRNLEARTTPMMLSQNFPNPFRGSTNFELQLVESSPVQLFVRGVDGRTLQEWSVKLDAGRHAFRFRPEKQGVYALRVLANAEERSIKMVCLEGSPGSGGLEYTGQRTTVFYKEVKIAQDFIFSPGDELLVVGYTSLGEAGLVCKPDDNTNCVLQFATNVPCPGLDSVYYYDQWYHTVQVFNQCWFKENLNVGEVINSTQSQGNNNLLEKYCILDNPVYCDTYGGMYTWDEMMAYNSSNQQGICPEGWHVPTDWDWKILEGAVDEELGIGHLEWEAEDWRGTNAGSALKEAGSQHWYAPATGTDSYGFRALPGGYFVQNSFWGLEYRAVFWSANPPAYQLRILDSPEHGVKRTLGTNPGNEAFSLRCIKDSNSK